MLSDPGGVRASHPSSPWDAPSLSCGSLTTRGYVDVSPFLCLRIHHGQGRPFMSVGLAQGLVVTSSAHEPLDDQLPGVFGDQDSGWLLGRKGVRAADAEKLIEDVGGLDAISARTTARPRRYRVESTRSPKTHRSGFSEGYLPAGGATVGGSSPISFARAENC